MLFIEYYRSSHNYQSSPKNITSSNLINPLNVYYSYDFRNNSNVSCMNIICYAFSVFLWNDHDLYSRTKPWWKGSDKSC